MAAISQPSPQPKTILNPGSLLKVCGYNPPEIVFYGSNNADWPLLTAGALNLSAFASSPIKKIMGWNMSHPTSNPGARTSLNGRDLRVITARLPINQEDPQKHGTKAVCKTSLTNIVLENVMRLRKSSEQTPLIPVVFTLQSSDAKKVAPSPLSMTEIDSPEVRVTDSELRRVYKLCFDPDVPREVQEAARKTFKFVKVDASAVAFGLVSIEPTPAPWENPGFEEAWKAKYIPKDRSTAGPEHWRNAVKHALASMSTPTKAVPAAALPLPIPSE